jgi:hypothetical protein
VVLEQVADHQGPAGRLGGGDGALGARGGLGERLLDEAVLAGAQHLLGELGVRRHGRGEDDGVELGVPEQVAQLARAPRGRDDAPSALQRGRVAVAEPGTSQSAIAAKLRARFGPQ